jgi:hypothetical protein
MEIWIRKENLGMIGDKINTHIVAPVDAHIGAHVVEASCAKLSVPTLNLSVENHDGIGRSCIHCGYSSSSRSH